MAAEGSRARLLLDTLRHVRPVQVWGRLLAPLRARMARLASRKPGLDGSPLPPRSGVGGDDGAAVPHHDPWNERARLLEGRFTFLQREARLGWPPDWTASSESLLWRFNLHYHQYLHLLRPEERSELCRHWVEQNPAETDVAWHPYVLSRRIVAWCRSLSLDRRLAGSLWRQADHLYRTVEWHHPGNHLLENGRALLVAACRFGDEPGAERWARRGGEILRRGLDDQLLPGGVHVERSPMYHALVFEGFVDALQALEGAGASWVKELANLRARLAEAVRRMIPYLRALTHPDGCLALLNDTTVEVAPSTARLLDYASGVLGSLDLDEVGTASFPDAGHFVYRGDEVYLVVDGGEIGPAHLPAHAHADLFTYELDVRGRRLVVDSGVYDYEEGPLRDYVRSTAAHNTVTVDGQDQAECWKSFRVARRFPPLDVEFRSPGEGCKFSGRFDGYSELIGDGIVHHRSLELEPRSRRLRVSDRVEGSGTHRVVSRLHFHPECYLERAGESTFEVNRDEVRARLLVEGGAPSIETGWYCPEFGLKMEKPVFCLVHEGELPARLTYTLEY